MDRNQAAARILSYEAKAASHRGNDLEAIDKLTKAVEILSGSPFTAGNEMNLRIAQLMSTDDIRLANGTAGQPIKHLP